MCFMESSPDVLTPESRFFLEPASSAQRQYEALRAYFVEGVSSAEVSRRFGYTAGSFPIAESLADEFLSLPMFPELTQEQIEYVARCVSEVVGVEALV